MSESGIAGAGAVVCEALIAGAAMGFIGGEKIGKAVATDVMQRYALAHECGSLNPATLAFSWRVQPEIGIAVEALAPPVAPIKPARKPAR
jgi:hypothetical protein